MSAPTAMPAPRSAIKTCMSGGTLNWLIAKAMLARKATTVTSQALRLLVMLRAALDGTMIAQGMPRLARPSAGSPWQEPQTSRCTV
jgi:hypothetical protein